MFGTEWNGKYYREGITLGYCTRSVHIRIGEEDGHGKQMVGA